jgi:uncharacterized membrane protein YqiK
MNNAKAAPLAIPVGRRTAIVSITLFATLLFGLPLLVSATSDHTIGLISSFYRSGSLVFGGGHVVLPLLQQAVAATMRSSPVMVRRRRFPARSSPSLPIWERR